MTHEQTVRDFIVENFLFGEAEALPDDSASLIDSGAIDSTAVLELVAFLETHFGIIVEDKDIVPANLDSISAITRFVSRKTASAA